MMRRWLASGGNWQSIAIHVRLAWREQALDDLDAIIDYIRQNNFRSAERMQDLCEACAERLTDHPYMYRAGRIRGTREAVVHPNYILI